MENSAANLGVEKGWGFGCFPRWRKCFEHSLELRLVELGSIVHARFKREAGLETENRVVDGVGAPEWRGLFRVVRSSVSNADGQK